MITSPANTFLLGETVTVSMPTSKILRWFFGTGATIQAKVNDELYVVLFHSSTPHTIENMAEYYGLPNRHLELEWGKFNGIDVEFIVPAKDITK
jgi:hypothetical protein